MLPRLPIPRRTRAGVQCPKLQTCLGLFLRAVFCLCLISRTSNSSPNFPPNFSIRSFFSFVADKNPEYIAQCSEVLAVPLKREPTSAPCSLDPNRPGPRAPRRRSEALLQHDHARDQVAEAVPHQEAPHVGLSWREPRARWAVLPSSARAVRYLGCGAY